MTFVLASSLRCVDRSIDRPPDALNRARESDSMESKIDTNRSTGPAAARDTARSLIAEMVREQEVRTGSLMLAYRVVGRLVSKSDTWVRRLVGHQAVGVSADTYLAAVRAYEAHCGRIEARATTIRAAAARRRRDADAIFAGLDGPDACGGGGPGEPDPDGGRPGLRGASS